MSSSPIDKIHWLAKEKGILRPRDLDLYGIPRRWMSRLHERGQLVRIGRGLKEQGCQSMHYDLIAVFC